MLKSRTGINRRSARGQLEFLVSIIVLSTILVLGSGFFLIDSGVSAFYKDKLLFITAQAANYAASNPGSGQLASTTKLVSDLCAKSGMRASNLKVQLLPGQSNGIPATVCNVDANFPLIQGSFLPGTVNMSASFASYMGTGPTSIVHLSVIGSNNQFLDRVSTASGQVIGSSNTITVLPQPAKGSGPGFNVGFGNTNTGGGTTIGSGNTNTGSGTVIGSGNDTSGSGGTIGSGNTNETAINCIGSGNVIN